MDGVHIWFIMILYSKTRQILLQNTAVVFLQNAIKIYYKLCQFFIYKYDSFIAKCDSYYKMMNLLQKASVRTAFFTPCLLRYSKTEAFYAFYPHAVKSHPDDTAFRTNELFIQ